MNLNQQSWEARLSELLVKDENAFICMLDGIRSNRISIDFLKNIAVNLSDGKSKLVQLATLRAISARELVISIFNKRDIQPITKAMLDADLGFHLERTSGEALYFSLIPTTEETRKKLSLKCKEALENAKISGRNSRQKILAELKGAKLPTDQDKRIKKSLDEIVNKFNDKLIKIYNQKVSELNSL